MKRRLFNTLSALSLLVCVAASVLWAEYKWWYAVSYTTSPHDASRKSIGIASNDGRLQVFLIFGVCGRHPGFEFERYHYYQNGSSPPDGFDPAKGSKVGDFYWYAYWSDGSLARCLALPWWFIGVVSAATPIIWLVRKVSSLRAMSPGACRACGYDLRATPDRCPECGTVPTGAAQ
jgi:hypothetical protein